VSVTRVFSMYLHNHCSELRYTPLHSQALLEAHLTVKEFFKTDHAQG